MRIAFFDERTGGHHATLLRGMVDAALRRGDHVRCITPEPPAGSSVQRDPAWTPVSERRVDDLWVGHRNLRRAVMACEADDIELFCDLQLDLTVLVTGPRLARVPRRVHLLHRVSHYQRSDRSGRGRMRTEWGRNRLRSLAGRGSRIAVLTDSAQQSLEEFLPPGATVRVPQPVGEAFAGRSEKSDPLRSVTKFVLFVGTVRPERGFDQLLEGLAEGGGQEKLKVVGTQRPGAIQRTRDRYPELTVVWDDRFLSDEELADAYRSAAFVALPYTPAFVASGGSSTVLFEAMACGVPVVVSRALAPQVPSGFAGAVIAERDDGVAFGEALRRARTELASLTAAAQRDGPGIIAAGHRPEHVLAELVDGSTATSG